MRTAIRKEDFFFKKFKTYSAAEVIAAGGATEFAKLTGHDPKRLYHLKGEHINDEDLMNALKDLERQ
ncbi:MAG: hypothetical protein U5N85_11045 [Arcicella sp.]|nr:hypothetical protein [Arcicella sp.]